MINVETDRFGRTYQIWKQNQENSCNIASVWMARGIARQMSFSDEEWDIAVRFFSGYVARGEATWGVDPRGPQSLNPAAFPNDQSSMASTFARHGLYPDQIVAILRNEGLNVVHHGNNGHVRTIEHHRIAYNKPAIACVYWKGGGGHAIVVGRATAEHVTYLDPWDGHHIVKANNGSYEPRYGGTGWVRQVIYISA